MRLFRSSLNLAVALAAALALLAAWPAAAQTPIAPIAATPLGVLDGYDNSEAWAVNASGLIVGASYNVDIDGDWTAMQACVWEPKEGGGTTPPLLCPCSMATPRATSCPLTTLDRSWVSASRISSTGSRERASGRATGPDGR
jgi:hypothetical protein